MATTTEVPPAERARRFAMILEGYEAEGPDCTVPGAGRVEKTDDGTVTSHPRYALVEQRGDSGYYFVNLADSRSAIAELAAEGIRDAHGSAEPICFFDLDELAGDEPWIFEGDLVTYGDTRFRVERVDEELIEGEVGRFLCLIDPDREADGWDDWDERAHEDEVEVLERGEPDERMPVRYGVAGIRTIVIFNTIPTEGGT